VYLVAKQFSMQARIRPETRVAKQFSMQARIRPETRPDTKSPVSPAYNSELDII